MKYYEKPITEIVEVRWSSSTLDGKYEIGSMNHESNTIGGDEEGIEILSNSHSTDLWDE